MAAHAPCCVWACLCFDVALCRRCAVNRYRLCKSGRAVAVSSEARSLFQHESIPRRSLTDLSACFLAEGAICLSLCPPGAYIHLLPLRPPLCLSLPVDLSVLWSLDLLLFRASVILTVFFLPVSHCHALML